MKLIVLGPEDEIPSFRPGDDAEAVICRMEHHIGGVYRLNAVRKPLGLDSYLIRARNKRALFWPGAKHPIKRVLHTRPGGAGKLTAGEAVNASLSSGSAMDLKTAVHNYLTGGRKFGSSKSCITGCHAPSPSPVWHGRQPFSDWGEVLDIIEPIAEKLAKDTIGEGFSSALKDVDFFFSIFDPFPDDAE